MDLRGIWAGKIGYKFRLMLSLVHNHLKFFLALSLPQNDTYKSTEEAVSLPDLPHHFLHTTTPLGQASLEKYV